MTKRYVRAIMPKSRCPKCDGLVSWIRPKLDNNPHKDPSFFICFDCGFIGQVGYGPVLEEQ